MRAVLRSPLFSFSLWLSMCLTVFALLDAYATRPVPVYVEAFRAQEMDDEQVLVQALQSAYKERGNFWWINEKRPYLVFESSRKYNVDPSFYAVRDIKITNSDDAQIGWIRPVPATSTP